MAEVALVQLQIAGTDQYAFQRRGPDAPTSPNCLGFFGGHMEADETPEVAARRELAEETSLAVEQLDWRFIRSFDVPSPKSESQFLPTHLFRAVIERADFQVYEGVGAETYTIQELLNRQDVGYVTGWVLRQDQKN